MGRDFPHAYSTASIAHALPLPAYRLRFPSWLSLLGATVGSCLIRGETQARIPAPGLSLFSCYLFWTKACRNHVMPVPGSLSPEPHALQRRMLTPSAPAPKSTRSFALAFQCSKAPLCLSSVTVFSPHCHAGRQGW